MKWQDVKQGQRVNVKGETWEVRSREGDAITMVHPTLGERTGSPPPDSEVQVVTAAQGLPKPHPASKDRPLFREKGSRPAMSERDERIVEKERKAQARKEAVARDNGVAVEAVEGVTVRLTLGGTIIAHLRPKATPEVPLVDVMDHQTMMNHLHFFHETYPEGKTLEELVTIHKEAEEHEKHEHSVPF